VRPQYSFDLSERNRLGVAGQYIDTDYNNEQPGEALDYTDARAELFFERATAQDSRVRLTAFASKYESDEISNDSAGYGGAVRYERDVSETFGWFVAAGAQRTDVEAGDNNQVDDSQTSYLFSSGITRQWELTRLQAQVSRSVDPSGSGFLKTRDGIRINVRHQFKQRLYGAFGAYAFTEDNLDDDVDVNKRDYARGRATLGWQMSKAWFIEGGYQYTYQDYDDEPGDAASNEVVLGIVYRPTRRVWSR
jgi:hypothetical protein